MRYILLSLALILTPLLSHAETPETLTEFLKIFKDIFSILIPIIFALTFITISWGVARAWIMGEASEEDVEKGKRLVFIGVIVLALMATVWGIVKMLSTTFFS